MTTKSPVLKLALSAFGTGVFIVSFNVLSVVLGLVFLGFSGYYILTIERNYKIRKQLASNCVGKLERIRNEIHQ